MSDLNKCLKCNKLTFKNELSNSGVCYDCLEPSYPIMNNSKMFINIVDRLNEAHSHPFEYLYKNGSNFIICNKWICWTDLTPHTEPTNKDTFQSYENKIYNYCCSAYEKILEFIKK